MSARKKQHNITFTTTAPMDEIMKVVSQLYASGGVQNLTVNEVEKVKPAGETN